MADPPRIITSNQFHDALVAAGVIRGDESYRRIIIDAGAEKVVIIHAERHGDERLLDVVRTLDGAEVRYGQPASAAQAALDEALRHSGPPQPTA